VGFDIGALAVKGVRLAGDGSVAGSFYRRHRGEVSKVLAEAYASLGVVDGDRLGFTGSVAAQFAERVGLPVLDLTRCQIAVVRRRLPRVRNIIDIGGASCTLVQLDAHGHFQSHATNSLCAAGTGSFLDEQAGRLKIVYEDAAAFEDVQDPPTIASRCSVFAKSDLIHRQQEGYSRPAMWSGLCRGMTRTMFGTLLRGQPLDGPTAVIGGVAQNREVVRWLRAEYPKLIEVTEDPHLVAAVGAAELGASPARPAADALAAGGGDAVATDFYDWPLTIERSKYPSFEIAEGYTDAAGNEVRVVAWPEGGVVTGYLGVDIGSTSTKLALLDEQARLVVDVYRKTAGDPIGAAKSLLRALRELAERKGARFELRGVGTTGSGRKIVGEVIGADAIINEISAHVAGAVHVDPTVETIFEIGGQDSKYMHVVDGHIRDANMNYACAAGTGSFVEEQANKLGYAVSKVGPAVMGVKPPRASDRCTVFMEQDVSRLIQAGHTPEQALSAVMVSVCKNYLNKVVGNRPRSSRKIFFQGATARNPGLVAAFERLLGVEVVVSPYCHVMGAYGVALLVRDAMRARGTPSAFRGLDLEHRKVTLRKEKCDLCQNDCTITFAEIEGVAQAPSWGYLCGRDPDESRVRVNENTRYLRARQAMWRSAGKVELPADAPVVGIPQTLAFYSYLPLWRRFFGELGYQVQLSGKTTPKIRELGLKLSGADFCFPAKVGIGHVAELATREGCDFVFVPHMKNSGPNEHTTGTEICPYVQGLHGFSKVALELNGVEATQLLAPFVDMRMTEDQIVKTLADGLARPLKRSRKHLRAAWLAGLRTQREFDAACHAEGEKALDDAKAKGEKLLVLVGRPYNAFDDGINLGLPAKIAERGRAVLPMDFLEPPLELLGDRYRNLYWSYGQKIIAVLERVAKDDSLDAVYLTNFSCGPDSFQLTYAEEIMGSRPFLALELDEHGADAGYLTRIEAFFDVLDKPRRPATARPEPSANPSDLKGRTVLLPPMHTVGTDLFAATFARHGYDARVLPHEDQEALEIGRSLTRGSECLPAALTIGTLVKTLRKEGDGDGKLMFFMPTAEGPCRFGQYCVLHRQILDREGYQKVGILSPSSLNAYQGIDEELRRSILKTIMVADVLLKARCKVRPYERNPGETDRAVAKAVEVASAAIARGDEYEELVAAAVRPLEAIPVVSGARKPLVGIVGEIYIRNNPFANEQVVDAVERFGGEVWMTPMVEWLLFTASPENYKQEHPTTIFNRHKLDALITYQWLLLWERRIYRAAGRLVADRHEPSVSRVLKAGARYMPVNIGGEAQLTLGRAIEFAKQGAAMVVNCSPFGCMPGVVSTALFKKISAELGMPIVNLFYDGNGAQNQRLEVFLANAVRQERSA
jgi:predicted CoA-substrate-specific enzyme activase